MKRFVSILLCATMLTAFASCSDHSREEEARDNKRIEDEEDNDRDADDAEDDVEEEEETEETTELIEEETSTAMTTGDAVTFSTVDREGNTWDDSVFADYELTIINFWEPWCGPCVGEMPDLEKLYEDYADQGLLIIGVYSEENMEEDVDVVLSDSGVTYPILRYTSEFDIYQSGYVPTTILVDRNGNIVDPGDAYTDGADSSLIVGSHPYREWADIADMYLGA